jgi:type IV secretory pathway TraG/TraD family ATPase VirD4
MKIWLKSELWQYLPLFSEKQIEIQHQGHVCYMTSSEVVRWLREYYINDIKSYWARALLVLIGWEIIGTWLANWIYRKFAEIKLHKKTKKRGIEPVSFKKLNQLLKKNSKRKARIKITKHIKLPYELENRHLAIIGASGTGKSVFIKNLLEQLKRYKDTKCIVFDVKGEYLSIFYDKEKDLIFNPIDRRCVPWDIYADIFDVTTEVYDIARSFVPPLKGESGNEKYFSDAARDVFASILEITYRQGGWEYDELANLVLSTPFEIYRFLNENKEFGGRKGLIHIAKPDSNQALGVCSTMSQYLRVIDVFRGLKREVSLRKWLQEGIGWLFLPMPAAYTELLAPAQTALVNLLMKEILSFPDDLERRVFFILDELGNLLYMNRLIDLATMGRSKGACLVVGTQDFSRIDKKYSLQDRKTLINNCKTWIIFRTAEAATLKELEESLGEAEIEESKKSYVIGVEDVRDGISYTKEIRIKKAFLASEIQQLKDLHCIVKIGEFPPAKDRIEFKKYKTIVKDFEMREISTISEVEETKAEAVTGSKEIKLKREEQQQKEDQKQENQQEKEVKQESEELEQLEQEEVAVKIDKGDIEY